jgi:preprotein translocase subunit YajC
MQMNTLLLQAPAGGNAWGMPLMMVGMIVVMYFFMIRPQAKRAKEQKKFSESLIAGEEVVTTSGIHGRISRASDAETTLQLEIARNTFVTIERSAVSMEMTQAARKKSGTATAAATISAS